MTNTLYGKHWRTYLITIPKIDYSDSWNSNLLLLSSDALCIEKINLIISTLFMQAVMFCKHYIINIETHCRFVGFLVVAKLIYVNRIKHIWATPCYYNVLV